MVVPEWIMPALVGGGMVFQTLLAIDRWVHKQGYDGVELAEELDTLTKRFEDGNKHLSRKMGEFQTTIGALQVDVARLKALDEAAHRHSREGD